MTKVVAAIYEGGALRPLEPVNLVEKERVYVLLLPDEPEKIAVAQHSALEDLIGIGESQETDMSTRHDDFLYTRRR